MLVINCSVGDITCCVVDYEENRAVARKKLKFRLVSREVINPRCIIMRSEGYSSHFVCVSVYVRVSLGSFSNYRQGSRF